MEPLTIWCLWATYLPLLYQNKANCVCFVCFLCWQFLVMHKRLSHTVGLSIHWSVSHAVQEQTKRRFNLRYCPCPPVCDCCCVYGLVHITFYIQQCWHLLHFNTTFLFIRFLMIPRLSLVWGQLMVNLVGNLSVLSTYLPETARYAPKTKIS